MPFFNILGQFGKNLCDPRGMPQSESKKVPVNYKKHLWGNF